MPAPDRILGVHIAAGVAYLALVDAPGTPILNDPVKLSPADAYTDATRLKDFHDRFMQMARDLRVGTVAVANTRLHAQWRYAAAFERVSLESAIMLASEAAQIKYVSVPQTKAVAKSAGIKDPREAANELAEALGITDVKHWNQRAVALMVALSLAKGGDDS